MYVKKIEASWADYVGRYPIHSYIVIIKISFFFRISVFLYFPHVLQFIMASSPATAATATATANEEWTVMGRGGRPRPTFSDAESRAFGGGGRRSAREDYHRGDHFGDAARAFGGARHDRGSDRGFGGERYGDRGYERSSERNNNQFGDAARAFGGGRRDRYDRSHDRGSRFDYYPEAKAAPAPKETFEQAFPTLGGAHVVAVEKKSADATNSFAALVKKRAELDEIEEVERRRVEAEERRLREEEALERSLARKAYMASAGYRAQVASRFDYDEDAVHDSNDLDCDGFGVLQRPISPKYGPEPECDDEYDEEAY